MADAVAKTSTPDAGLGNPIDITTVTTGAGVVDRQRVSIADAAAANNAAVSAAGALKVDGSAAVSMNTGVRDATTQRVTVATNDVVPVTDNAGSLTIDSTQLPAALVGARLDVNIGATIAVPVTDNAGSLTVDAPVGTPVFARLSDGAAVLIGQKVMASSLPVVVASDQTVIPVSDNAGSLTVDAPVGTPVFARLSDGAAALVGQKTMALSLPVVLASDQASVPVVATAPTLTKGTQGATGYSVQNLKDAGRNQTNYFMAVPIITTVAEVMMAMTGYKGGIAVAANVSPAVVTAGKTYRIQSITITYFNVAAVGSVRVTLRANLTGLGVIGSPLVNSWQVGLSGDGASTAGHVSTYAVPIPDGMEFSAGTGIAIGIQGEGAVPTTGTIVGYGKVEILGYEY